MKQITLSEGEFKSLLDGVKHSAAIMPILFLSACVFGGAK